MLILCHKCSSQCNVVDLNNTNTHNGCSCVCGGGRDTDSGAGRYSKPRRDAPVRWCLLCCGDVCGALPVVECCVTVLLMGAATDGVHSL